VEAISIPREQHSKLVAAVDQPNAHTYVRLTSHVRDLQAVLDIKQVVSAPHVRSLDQNRVSHNSLTSRLDHSCTIHNRSSRYARMYSNRLVSDFCARGKVLHFAMPILFQSMDGGVTIQKASCRRIIAIPYSTIVLSFLAHFPAMRLIWRCRSCRVTCRLYSGKTKASCIYICQWSDSRLVVFQRRSSCNASQQFFGACNIRFLIEPKTHARVTQTNHGTA
jgi:hypothetical protein